jgi:signal transduction histidine kinase
MVRARRAAAAAREPAEEVSSAATREALRAPSSALVFAILIATTLGVAGSMIYSSHVGAKLDENALSIATDASPAIEHLSAARGEVLRVHLAAVSAVEHFTEEMPVDRAPFDRSLSILRDEVTAYRALPFYPYESEHFDELEGAIRDLEGQVAVLVGHLGAKDRDAAIVDLRTALSPAAARADDALELLTNFNAREEHRLGVEIPTLRKHADRVGYRLAAVAASLGGLLMLLVMLAVRRYQTLLRSQNLLADARAREVAEFGSKLESLIAASRRIAESITIVDDREKVFQTIADEARGIVDAHYSAVGVGTDPLRPFDPWVSSGMPAAVADALGSAPRPAGLLGAVIREGHLIRIDDLGHHPAFRGLPAHHPPMGPFLGVPIVHDGDNVGNLYLSRTKGAAPFTERDERAALLLAGYVGVSITNSRLYNQAMLAKRAREDLLAAVSHDLKNPLSIIRIASHVLRRSADKGTVDLAERIDRTAERMTGLINDLLEASKIEAGVLRAAPKSEPAAPLVESAIDIFTPIANEKSIQLHGKVPCSPLAVLCERDLVSRVFSNLIGNAIKFSPAGSSVAVVAKENRGEVQFSVTDSGPGIQVGQLPHVFDRYWQEKRSDRRGSGLGLYIAKGIVEAHGGRIWVEDTSSRGTTMSFTLPVVVAREGRDAPSARDDRPDTASGRPAVPATARS